MKKPKNNMDEYIRWLRGYANQIELSRKDLHMAKDLFEIADYLKSLPREPQECKWIPCSERLPKQNGVYQITRKICVRDFVHDIVTCAYFDGQDTWHNDNGVNSARKYLKDVIAWCPMAEPYKEGES